MKHSVLAKPASRRPAPRRSRRGAAVIEFVVCLPVIVMIVFASIEACSMIFLRQSLQTTAYEAVRVACNMNGTADTAIKRGTEMLAQRKVKNGKVQVQPTNLPAVATGDPVTITVSAPLDANRLFPKWFMGSGTFVVSCVMLREGNNFRNTPTPPVLPPLP